MAHTITKSSRTNVSVSPLCRDICQALGEVPNGARLVGAAIADTRVELIFDYEEKS